MLKTFIEATYPPGRKAAREEGSVLLFIEISAVGAVQRVSVGRSGGADFDAAALDAAQNFVFEPAEVDDTPAAVKISYRYDFSIVEAPVAPSPTAEPRPKRLLGAPVGESTADDVVVRGPRPRRDVGQISIAAAEARLVAGTQGDVLKVVQNLPGVARPPLASGQLVVWGSAPKETRVYVDGVEIPALYHGSALRSTINSDLVASIELVPGAYGADYSRGLGGLVRIETRALPSAGTHGYLSADTLDTSGMVSTQLGAHVRVGVAARYSYVDRVLAATSAQDIGDLFPVPRYRDYQAKATLDLRENETIDLVFLGSNDELTRTVPSADPVRTRAEQSASSFHRIYAKYTRVTDDGDVVNVTPFFGYDNSRVTTSFGEAPTRLEIGSFRYGVRGSDRIKLSPKVTLAVGVDALGSRSRVARGGSLTLPAREGDVTVFGQPPGDDTNADSSVAHIFNLGPYVSADVQLGKLTITPGVRFDAFLIEGDRMTPRLGVTPGIGSSRLEGAVDPRLAVRYQVSQRLGVVASAGVYHQAPEPEDLGPVFGTPALGLSKATHLSLGEVLRITPRLSAEVTGFGKSLTNLVVRSQNPTPTLARGLVQDGQGRSYGVQLLLRHELWRGFFGWASYAITRSERKYLSDETYRLFDFDQPHVLTLVGSQELGRFTLGARFRYASGSPRTPVIASFYDARDDRYEPIFGPRNSARIPDFYQLDLRIERVIPFGRTTLAIYGDVQNVTFHKNREELAYSSNFKTRDYITGLPTLAIVGARLEF